MGCLSGISPFGFLRYESVTCPVHPQRTKDTSNSLSSLIKAQSHQFIFFRLSFSLCPILLFYAFSICDRLRISNHFSYTHLKILNVDCILDNTDVTTINFLSVIILSLCKRVILFLGNQLLKD